MARPTPAASLASPGAVGGPSRKRAPVTGMVLAALFTLLGVLGLQGVPAGAPAGSAAGVPAPAAAAAAAAHHVAHTAAPGVHHRVHHGVDDTCATACGQPPPRAGRVTPGEWHAPPPGAVSVPAGLVLPLPEPGPPAPAPPGAFAALWQCAQHSGRGPPLPTGI
ncbi:hypothetical protein [Streptomyces sp. MMBL 11-3]|uniref:hypothetical protein n=1 Tax=Streptomyces sp. MMBL 11-3 TaxID=3382639 RepID=UPI0039B6C33C